MPTLQEIEEAKKLSDQYIDQGPTNYNIEAAEQLIEPGGLETVIEDVSIQEPSASPNQGLKNLLGRAEKRRNESRFGTDILRATDTISQGILGKKSDPNAFKYDKTADEDVNYYRDLLEKHKSKASAEASRQKKRKESLVDFEKKEKIRKENKATTSKSYKSEQASNLVEKGTGEPVIFDPNTQGYVNANTKKPAKGVEVAPLRTSPTKREEINLRKVEKRTGRVDSFRKQPDVKKLIEQADASKDALKLLKSKNPIGDKLVKDMIIKSLGDSRISDKDVGRLGGSPALASRAKNLMSELFDGTMSEENRGYFIELLEVLKDGNIKKFEKKARGFAKRSSNTKGKKDLYGSEQEIYDNATLDLIDGPQKEEKKPEVKAAPPKPEVKAAPPKPEVKEVAQKKAVRKQHNKKLNKTRITYDDGSVEVVDGLQ